MERDDQIVTKTLAKLRREKQKPTGEVNFVASLPKDSSFIVTMELSELFSVNNFGDF